MGKGRLLIWDITYSDRFTLSHPKLTAREGGGDVAEQAEWATYSALEPTYLFLPVALESSGVSGPN